MWTGLRHWFRCPLNDTIGRMHCTQFEYHDFYSLASATIWHIDDVLSCIPNFCWSPPAKWSYRHHLFRKISRKYLPFSLCRTAKLSVRHHKLMRSVEPFRISLKCHSICDPLLVSRWRMAGCGIRSSFASKYHSWKLSLQSTSKSNANLSTAVFWYGPNRLNVIQNKSFLKSTTVIFEKKKQSKSIMQKNQIEYRVPMHHRE